MKKTFLIIFLFIICWAVFGQVTEYGISLNSGLFRFTGKSAEKTEQINFNLDKEDGYTNNPYGNKYAVIYGLSGSIRRINKSQLRLGMDVGYDLLRSKIDINAVWTYSTTMNVILPAKGKANLNNSFINIFPNFGYQFTISSIVVFVDGGMDLGYCFKAIEKAKASSDLRVYETVRNRKTIDFDFRPRFQIGMQKQKLGGYFGYSLGLINYKSRYDGGINEAYSNLIRMGFTYKLK